MTLSTRKYTLESEIKNDEIKLLFISSSKFENDWPSFPHSHHFTEIFFIKSGAGYLQIEGKNVPIHSNDLILIRSCSQHTEFSIPGNPMEYYVIGVDGLKFGQDDSKNYNILKYSSNATTILEIFENIFLETKNKQSGYAEICHHYLSILILHIYRKMHISFDASVKQTQSRECHVAKEYIEAHFNEKITLDMLAEICCLTKFYLSHRFSDIYGKSPMTYLTEIRISAAKDLLITTNHSIEEIADTTGFSSGSYFSQTFQKICHISPQKFRQLHKN